MRGNVEFASGQCAHCGERRKLERPSAVWGAGDLIMIVITIGVWAILKIAMRPAWRCTACGTATNPN